MENYGDYMMEKLLDGTVLIIGPEDQEWEFQSWGEAIDWIDSLQDEDFEEEEENQ